MNRTALMITIYAVSAGLISVVITGHMQLGLAVLAVLLPILYFGNLYWEKRQSKGVPSSHQCLSCQNRIGWLRRFSHHRFCSQEHETQWLDELEQLAVARLQIARNETPEPIRLPKPVASGPSDAASPELALVLVNH